jgi:hypothetical protein
MKKYYPDRQTEDKMGGECGTYGVGNKCLQSFRWGSLKETRHLEEPGIDGILILKLIVKKYDGR